MTYQIQRFTAGEWMIFTTIRSDSPTARADASALLAKYVGQFPASDSFKLLEIDDQGFGRMIGFFGDFDAGITDPLNA